ncbi:MAG: ABC transporter ATP-binding protein [Desulfurococcus sp.]|nr:ABC transporter ATP-binding protein [Desulfurococcus sp.]
MLLQASNIYFKYPDGTEALRGAGFEVDSCEVVALLGANGSGKSTLLMVAAGLLEPTRGEVLFDGKPLREQLPWARRHIGVLFQNPDDQLFNPTVRDEIAFALRQLGYSCEETSRRIHEVAVKLGVEGILDKPPYKLSLGEKKRVALASILVYEPRLLLLDEPSASLPPRVVELLERLIREWRRECRAVVIASHDVDFVARIADRVYLLDKGRVVGRGAARELLGDEETLAGIELAPPTPVRVARMLGYTGSPPVTLEELVELVRGCCLPRA